MSGAVFSSSVFSEDCSIAPDFYVWGIFCAVSPNHAAYTGKISLSILKAIAAQGESTVPHQRVVSPLGAMKFDPASTDRFYQTQAADYASLTCAADLSATYAHFLPRLPSGGRILDVGCGAGRDLKAFAALGFKGTGIDASSALCTSASDYAGVPCHVMRIENLTYRAAFEGIWACASLLHLPRLLLPTALRRLREALVAQGILYASVQIGAGDWILADGRAYAYYQSAEFSGFIADAGFRIEESWESGDTLKRASVPWLNVIASAI
jgi:SAM-dependent methyltransferase